MKLIKIIIAILLLPFCYTFTKEFIISISKYRFDNLPHILFISGFATYIFIHLVIYRPIMLHIIGHEATHAFWSFLFGGKVKGLQIEENRGRVKITKSNFLITLAPYFFPIYAFVIIVIYFLVKDVYKNYCIFLIGVALGFHLMLTVYSIKVGQSDIKETGVIFSLVFVYLVNIIVLGIIVGIIFPEIINIKNFLVKGIVNVTELKNIGILHFNK